MSLPANRRPAGCTGSPASARRSFGGRSLRASQRLSAAPRRLTCAVRITRPDCAITLPFGRPVAVSADGRSGFPPGAVFAQLVRAAARRGPDRWRLLVLRAGGADRPVTRIAGVYPGAEILLCVTGKGRSERVLRAVTALRRLGIDPATASPAWFAAIGAAVAVDVRPHPYSADQHAAHHARRQVGG